MSDKHIDDISGVETTGHVWDGIRELNNPLPRWWLWTFYLTVIWSIGYTIAYPAWPLISSATTGVLGYSSRAELSKELSAVEAGRADMVAAVAKMSPAEILADEELRRFAAAAGEAAYKVNCSQCHGSGAQGAAGYPNLNDDDWLWGGDIDAIYQTIAHGVRFDGDDDTRFSEMPAFGDILSSEDVNRVAAYVYSLTGDPSDAAEAEAGAAIYADNCAACHGEDGKGMTEFGAPNLADAIWFYGSDEKAIAAQIKKPAHGVMPAWQGRLGDVTVKQLAVYVHSLGGGE